MDILAVNSVTATTFQLKIHIQGGRKLFTTSAFKLQTSHERNQNARWINALGNIQPKQKAFKIKLIKPEQKKKTCRPICVERHLHFSASDLCGYVREFVCVREIKKERSSALE